MESRNARRTFASTLRECSSNSISASSERTLWSRATTSVSPVNERIPPWIHPKLIRREARRIVVHIGGTFRDTSIHLTKIGVQWRESKNTPGFRERQSMRHAEQDALTGNFFKWNGPQDRHFVSCNFDETHALVNRDVGEQKYELLTPKIPFSARIEFRKLEYLTLSHAWFAPAMVIKSLPIRPYYTLYLRRHGGSEYRLRKKMFVSAPARGAFLPGMQPVEVRTRANWHALGARFLPEAFQTELSHLLGRDIVNPIEFDPIVDFRHGAGRFVRRIVLPLHEGMGQDEFGRSLPGLGLQQIQRTLITLILEGLGHNYSKILNGPTRSIAPWQVRAVENFIIENADESVSLGDLSLIAGVSARSLQYSFRRHKGCSPIEFLQLVRLDRVREDLLAGEPQTTVTTSAMRRGFFHLGRFSAAYRTRFNENPKDTLRRSQRLWLR